MEGETPAEKLEDFARDACLEEVPSLEILDVLSTKADILKSLTDKEILLIFLRVGMRKGIENISIGIHLGKEAINAKNDAISMHISLSQLKSILLSKRICELFGVDRKSDRFEEDCRRIAKGDFIPEATIEAAANEIAQLTLKEMVEAASISKEQLMHHLIMKLATPKEKTISIVESAGFILDEKDFAYLDLSFEPLHLPQ
jgi:hypothetical protein